ncbi:PF2R protein, partial [Amia calva]|nr:PF2R protein [Amia calva]
MPCFSMTLGCISNILALTILFKSYSRFRRRSKATFFLLAGALLLTDLSGHIILGAFALRLYLSILWKDYADHSEVFCQVFGACMVFFGLCPLFLGSAMAVERCVGVTRPLLHSTAITATHAKLAVALLFSLSILLATLPLTQVGSYVRQFPDTWCFLQIHDGLSKANQGLTLAFTSLGLASLGLSLLCNCLSGMALLQARLRGRSKAKSKPKTPGVPQRKSAPSHDVEMMLQLAGITLVSFICWTPFLVSGG